MSVWWLALALVMVVVSATPFGHAAAQDAPPSLSAAATAAQSAVVTLKLAGKDVLYGMLVDEGPDDDDVAEEPAHPIRDIDLTLGSAVIVEDSGIAVTTARLGRRGFRLTAVTFDGRSLTATVVGRDEETDVAVLMLCCDSRPLPSITLADSDRVRAGDWVLAIGAPFGLDRSVTAAVITSVTREDHPDIGHLIHTGGSVTSGYAGGPIVDTRGAMIGLVVGTDARTGMALPSNAVRKIVAALLEDGRVRRGSLGIKGQTLDADLAPVLGAPDARGVVIVDVRRDGPAARAGLRPGDILREIDGRPLESSSQTLRLVGSLQPGRVVRLKVWQHRKERTLEVRLDEDPDEEAVGSARWRARALLGAEVEAITSDMGVMVARVDPDGPAARAGIRRADVIREMNGRSIRVLGDLDEALRAVRLGVRIAILLQRGPASLYLTFTP